MMGLVIGADGHADGVLYPHGLDGGLVQQDGGRVGGILVYVDIAAGDEGSAHGLYKIGVTAEMDEVDAFVGGDACIPGVAPAIGPVLGNGVERFVHTEHGAAAEKVVF